MDFKNIIYVPHISKSEYGETNNTTEPLRWTIRIKEKKKIRIKGK